MVIEFVHCLILHNPESTRLTERQAGGQRDGWTDRQTDISVTIGQSNMLSVYCDQLKKQVDCHSTHIKCRKSDAGNESREGYKLLVTKMVNFLNATSPSFMSNSTKTYHCPLTYIEKLIQPFGMLIYNQ